MKYTFEVKRDRMSVTQGSATVYLNGEEVVTFDDEPKLINGEWKSVSSDADFIKAALYHSHDYVYHHSDKIKAILNRDSLKKNNE